MENKGFITQIIGVVVDIKFSEALPKIWETLYSWYCAQVQRKKASFIGLSGIISPQTPPTFGSLSIALYKRLSESRSNLVSLSTN